MINGLERKMGGGSYILNITKSENMNEHRKVSWGVGVALQARTFLPSSEIACIRYRRDKTVEGVHIFDVTSLNTAE